MRLHSLVKRSVAGLAAMALLSIPAQSKTDSKTDIASGLVTPLSEASPQFVIESGGHKALILELIFTADGRELISVSHDKTIRVWSVHADGKGAALSRTIRGQMGNGRAGSLWAADLSPADEQQRHGWLAVGGILTGSPQEQYAIRLHDYASGDIRALLQGHRDIVLALAFSPDGRWLASAGKDKTVRLWDMTTLQGSERQASPLILSSHTQPVYDLAWSAAGDRLASASYDRTVGLWNTETLRQGKASLVARLQGHTDHVRTVVFHPDGTVLLSGGKDETIRLWRARDGKSLKVFARSKHKISGLSFSPDGHLLLAGNLAPPRPQQLTLFAYPTGKRQHIFTEHRNTVFATAFHPSGKWVASGGGDQKEILLWNPETGDVLSRLEGEGRTIEAVGFSDDGRYISWGYTTHWKSVNDRGPLAYWFELAELQLVAGKAPSKSVVRALENVGKLSFETQRRGDADPFLLSVRRARKQLGTIERDATNGGYWHSAYTFTPDGNSVLSGGQNGLLELYTLDGQRQATLVGHTGQIKAVAVSADGRWALSGSNDQTVILWSLNQLTASEDTKISPTFTLFPAINGEWIVWTPDGYFAASRHGAQLTGYSINQGTAKMAQYISTDQLYDQFYRPDLIHTRLRGNVDKQGQQEHNRTNAKTVLAKGLPPQIMFVGPTSDETVTDSETQVKVKVVDQGGGIGRIVWKIDGVTVGVKSIEPRQSGRPAPSNKAVLLTKKLSLIPGKNLIEVVAYTQNHDLASTPAKLNLMLKPSASLTVAALPKLPVPISALPEPPAAPKPTVSTTTSQPPAPLPTPQAPRPPSMVTERPPTSADVATSSAQPKPGPSALGQESSNQASTIPPDELRPDLYLFVIGINRYRDRDLLLRYAVNDAKSIVKTVSATASPLFRHIHVTELFDDRVTMMELDMTFAKIAADIAPQDVFILYLAGHGVTREDRYYFFPQDFRYVNDDAVQKHAISQDHFQRWLASIPARKSLILVDTCESGSLTNPLVAMRGIAKKTAIAKLTRATGRATIVASTSKQPAMEGYNGHGVFTYALVQGLQYADAKFGNRDGYTGLFELASYVNDQVPELTMKAFDFEQIPQVHMLGTDFPIGVAILQGS